jgi:putative endonuclease
MYFVYVLASRRYGTLYIGVTRDLRRRLEQHRSGAVSSFTRQYRFIAWFTSNPSTTRKMPSGARSS